MNEEELQRKLVLETLEECLRLGLVEVVGINEIGEWLYRATERGIRVLNSSEGYLAAFNAIINAREEDKD